MATRFLQRLLPILLIDASHCWTLAPSMRSAGASLRAARASAVTMNAAEEAKIRKSLGSEEPANRHGAMAAAAGGGAAAAPEGAQVAVGAEAEAAARQASFEEAQALGSQLAELLAESCAEGEPMPAEAVGVLRALISTSSGARGWFVTLLTDERFDAVFAPPLDASLLSAIADTLGSMDRAGFVVPLHSQGWLFQSPETQGLGPGLLHTPRLRRSASAFSRSRGGSTRSGRPPESQSAAHRAPLCTQARAQHQADDDERGHVHRHGARTPRQRQPQPRRRLAPHPRQVPSAARRAAGRDAGAAGGGAPCPGCIPWARS